MIWNTVECVGLYHLIIEHRIFVSVVQRNHNAAFICGIKGSGKDILNSIRIICLVKAGNQFFSLPLRSLWQVLWRSEDQSNKFHWHLYNQ